MLIFFPLKNSVIVSKADIYLKASLWIILNNTESILGGDFKNIPEDIKREYIPKLKIIPFASLGKQNGMLVGIKPEKIEIINEQTEENKNAIIGIYNKSLTKKGEYNALIGIELY